MCFCFDCVSYPEATLINSINEKTNNIYILYYFLKFTLEFITIYTILLFILYSF